MKGAQVKTMAKVYPGKAKFDRQAWRAMSARRMGLMRIDDSKKVKIANVWARVDGG